MGESVTTLALGSRPRLRGLQGCGPKGRKPGSQGKRKPGSHITYSRESHHVLPGVTSRTHGSVRKCEGMNPHTPKATPTWGDGVPVDSQNFIERFQGSKLNGSWRSLYYWKALGA